MLYRGLACLYCCEKRHVEDVGPDGVLTIRLVPDVVVQHRATQGTRVSRKSLLSNL
jgi:hypothetical protein